MKKILSVILAALIAATFIVPVLAEGEAEGAQSDAEEAVVIAAEEDKKGEDEAEEGSGILTVGAESEEESGILTVGAESEEESGVLTVGAESEEESGVLTVGEKEPTVIICEGAPDYVLQPDEYYSNYDFSTIFDDDGHFKDLTASDYVKPNNYDPLVIGKEEYDKIVDDEIDEILKSFEAPAQLTDKVIEDGDTVNIDYVGTVDGEEFSGGNTNGAGTNVTIGVTTYIDGFLEQLIGHKPGETFDVNVTFPEVYEKDPDIAGKDAVFSVTINYVVGENVIPEFTDDFVTKNITPSIPEVTTAAEFRDYIATNENFRSGIIVDKLAEENEFSGIPAEVYSFAVDLVVMGIYRSAEAYGVDVKTLVSYGYGMTLEELIRDYAEDNVKVAKRMLVVQAIDEMRDDISVTEEAMKEFAADNLNSEDYSEAIDEYGVGLYKMYVLQDVVIKYINEHADFSGSGSNGSAKSGQMSTVKLIAIIACCAIAAVLLIVVVVDFIKNRKKPAEVTESAEETAESDAETEDESDEAPSLISISDVLGAPEEEKEEDAEDEVGTEEEAETEEEVEIPEETEAAEEPVEEEPVEEPEAEDEPEEAEAEEKPDDEE